MKVDMSDSSNYERARIIAMHNWLSGNITGALSTYMYTDDPNDMRWKNGHSANTYYVSDDEKSVLNIVLKEINLAVENYIDLGPGGKDAVLSKSIPLMQAVKANSYYPVDISSVFAKTALATVKEHTNKSGQPVIADFFEKIPIVKEDAILTIMGATACNFETIIERKYLKERLSKIYSNWRSVISKRGYFLLSFDANENEHEIVSCYNNAEFSDLVRSCIAKDIDTQGFDYEVVWTPNNYQLATGLRSNREQDIVYCGTKYHIAKGIFLPVLNSYRLPEHFVIDAANNAGWRHIKTWTVTGKMHYCLFQAQN